MSPENAKVCVIEDDDLNQKIIAIRLTSSGHSVVLTAKNRQQAMEAVRKMEEMGIQVATVDGNLTEHDKSGDDGRTILSAIRKQSPNVKIVGVSTMGIEGADANVAKGNLRDLGKVITNL